MQKFRKMNATSLHENKNEMEEASSRRESTEPAMLRETPLPPKHRVVSSKTPQSVSECHDDGTVLRAFPLGRGAFSAARVPRGGSE